MQVDSEISIKFPYRLDEDDDNVSSSIGSAMPFNLLTSFTKNTQMWPTWWKWCLHQIL